MTYLVLSDKIYMYNHIYCERHKVETHIGHNDEFQVYLWKIKKFGKSITYLQIHYVVLFFSSIVGTCGVFATLNIKAEF